MTWEQILKRIMERFDSIDARLDEFHERLVTLEDRTTEMPDMKALDTAVDDINRGIGRISCDCDAESAFALLGNLVEAEHRRELAEMREGARAAMRLVS